MKLLPTHHLAIICTDYANILGIQIISEVYRRERDSYKLDLRLPDNAQIELFSFPRLPTSRKPSWNWKPTASLSNRSGWTNSNSTTPIIDLNRFFFPENI